MRRNGLAVGSALGSADGGRRGGRLRGRVLLVAGQQQDRADDQQQQQEQQEREDDPELLRALGLLAEVAAAVRADVGALVDLAEAVRALLHRVGEDGGGARGRGGRGAACRRTSSGRPRALVALDAHVAGLLAVDPERDRVGLDVDLGHASGPLARDDLGLHLGPAPHQDRAVLQHERGAGLPLAEPQLQRHEQLAGVVATDVGGQVGPEVLDRLVDVVREARVDHAGARPIGGFVECLCLILARCHASGGAYLDRRHLPRNYGAG